MITTTHEVSPVRVANEFVQSRYVYTSNEIDLMCHVLAKVQHVKQTNSQFSQVTINLEHICQFMGDSNSNYSYIRAALRGLLSKPLEIYDKEARSYNLGNVISFGRIDMRRGIVVMNIDPFMMPYLVELKKEFTVFQLSSILKLKSKHSKRIYLMCSQFKNLELIIELDELKKRLGLEGNYPRFSDFNERVLQTAIAEINELSDLDVQLINKPHKGVTVFDVVISVTQKKRIHELSHEREQERIMLKIGLSEWQVVNIMQSLKREQIQVILVNAWNMFTGPNKGRVQNKAAYLVRVFENEGVPLKKPLPQQLRMDAVYLAESLQHEFSTTRQRVTASDQKRS